MRMMQRDTERDQAFLTSGEAARWLHLGKKTLLHAVVRGDLVPAHRTPRGYARFRAADIRAYAVRLSTAHAAAVGPDAGTTPHAEVAPSPPVGAALLRLATLALADAPDVDDALAGILALLADSLDVGVTFLSRVGEATLRVERAHDRAGMGLASGTVVPLCDTY